MAQHKTLFISDLHLDEREPSITKSFLYFLETEVLDADALYILGDLFEAWIGDDDQTPFHQSIISALKALTDSGVPVFVMRGNRDFLIGKRFAQETGSTLINDPTVIDIYDKRVLLCHGDSLCTLDRMHQRARVLMHNPFLRWFTTHCVPLRFRRFVARDLRKASSKRNKTLPKEIMDVTESAFINILNKYKTDMLIHGHTHRPGTHYDHGKMRIVLGAWHDHGNALFAHPNGTFDYKTFT